MYRRFTCHHLRVVSDDGTAVAKPVWTAILEQHPEPQGRATRPTPAGRPDVVRPQRLRPVPRTLEARRHISPPHGHGHRHPARERGGRAGRVTGVVSPPRHAARHAACRQARAHAAAPRPARHPATPEHNELLKPGTLKPLGQGRLICRYWMQINYEMLFTELKRNLFVYDLNRPYPSKTHRAGDL